MSLLPSAALLALGFFLASSTWPKLRRPHVFSAALMGYGVSRWLALVLGPILIALEGVAAVLCLVPFAPRVAGLMAFGLLVTYSAMVAFTLLRGKSRISCGCFAFGHDRAISWTPLARNGLGALLAATAAVPERSLGTISLLTKTGASVRLGA